MSYPQYFKVMHANLSLDGCVVLYIVYGPRHVAWKRRDGKIYESRNSNTDVINYWVKEGTIARIELQEAVLI